VAAAVIGDAVSIVRQFLGNGQYSQRLPTSANFTEDHQRPIHRYQSILVPFQKFPSNIFPFIPFKNQILYIRDKLAGMLRISEKRSLRRILINPGYSTPRPITSALSPQRPRHS